MLQIPLPASEKSCSLFSVASQEFRTIVFPSSIRRKSWDSFSYIVYSFRLCSTPSVRSCARPPSPPATHRRFRRHLPVATGNRQKPAKTSSSAKELSGTASGVTLTTDLDSDDSGDDSNEDDVPNQEQHDLWPAAEYSPPGSVSSNSGGRTGRGSPPSVVGQYVDISGDGGWGGSDDKGMEDVEDGYQTGLAAAAAGAAAAGNRAGVQPAFHVSAEDEAKHGDVVGRETSTLGDGGWLARKLRLRLPSRGDMLIYGGFLLNVSTKGTISCFETIGAAYAITTFSLTSAEVTRGDREGDTIGKTRCFFGGDAAARRDAQYPPGSVDDSKPSEIARAHASKRNLYKDAIPQQQLSSACLVYAAVGMIHEPSC